MKEVTGLAGMGGQDTGGVAVGGVGVLRPWEQGRCRAGSQASWVTAVTGQWMRIPESAVREKPEAESQLLGKHTGKQCREHLPAQSRPARSPVLTGTQSSSDIHLLFETTTA